jgi:hypothetical protein
MTQHPDIKFPWQDFAVWLREGITAAHILNKFMIASWPEEHRRERGVSLAPLPVMQEETELLRVVEARVAQERAEALKFADKLEEGHAYFAISAAQAQSLWSAFMEYSTDGERSHAIKEGLKTLIQIHPDNVDASAVAFMDHLWKTLGPATAPDRRAIEKASS